MSVTKISLGQGGNSSADWNFPNIMQREGLFLSSYETVNDTCSETDESSSNVSTLFL